MLTAIAKLWEKDMSCCIVKCSGKNEDTNAFNNITKMEHIAM